MLLIQHTIMVNKYKKSKIYKLVNEEDNEVYVGATTKTLSTRFRQHKNDSKRYNKQHVYAHLNNVGWDKIQIVLLETYPCCNMDELKARERYWIEQLKPTLNSVIPTRTHKESYLHRIEHNKEHVMAQRRKDRRLYKQRHREKCRALAREHAKVRTAKIVCECGSIISQAQMFAHRKTKLHTKRLQEADTSNDVAQLRQQISALSLMIKKLELKVEKHERQLAINDCD